MIKFKTKMIDINNIKVKSKYDGDLNNLQLEMIAIMVEFGIKLTKKGVKKEKVEEVLDNILRVSKENIKYNV